MDARDVLRIFRLVIKDALSKNKGERVRPFPLVGPDDTSDVKKYLELLVKATEELLIHFDYDKRQLEALIFHGRDGKIINRHCEERQ